MSEKEHSAPAPGVNETTDDESVGPASEARSRVAEGTRVGRYQVLEHIGAGAMGVVYAAYDPDLDRKVAVKLLQPERMHGERGSRGQARLVQEAKSLARLSHPNVIAVHDVGTFGSRVFVAMEFVAGETLTQWLRTSRPWKDVVTCLVAAGRGLAAAHARGLVHRDFKPDNVLVGTDGRPRVLDFGLARPTAGSGDVRVASAHDSGLASDPNAYVNLTKTGGIAGTPAYMAPEQYLGELADERSDQFAFCVVLWEALYGERPFKGETPAALGMVVCRGTFTPPPTNTTVPPWLLRLLVRGIAVDPNERHPSIQALLDELTRAPRASSRTWFGIAAGAGAVAALVYAAQPGDSEVDPCGAGTARIAKAWTPNKRAAIESAFTRAEQSPNAAAVLEHLDVFAADWEASHRAACEATLVRHEQSHRGLDLRMACLERRLHALSSTADALANADADALRKSTGAVQGLPVISDCADPRALELSLALPEDPKLAEVVTELRGRIVEVESEAVLWVTQSSVEAASGLVDEALESGHKPVLAEAHYLAARILMQTGDAKTAEARLLDAASAALASDHDQLLARIFTYTAQVVGIYLSRYEDGLRWGRLASASVDRLGEDTAEQAFLAQVMCKLLADKGDHDAAIAHCHHALELNTTLRGNSDLAVATAHEALGIALFYKGEHVDAENEFEFARDAFITIQGPSHPDLVRVENSLAAVCYGQKGAEPCLSRFEDVLRRSQAVMGSDHPSVADYSNNLAQLEAEAGKLVRARAHATDGLRIWRSLRGDEHPGTAASLRILGQVAEQEGKLELAQTHLEAAVKIAVATRGKEHRDVYSSRRHLGDVLAARGDVAAAREEFGRALRIAKALGEETTDIDTALAALPSR